MQAYQKRARGGDRLARRDRARAPSPADGAAGQGRLLGHRGQARAGARARRLSGVHAQGDDRSLLRRLHAAAAGGARAALSAIRHPQCAHGRERDRGCRRRRRLRIPAPARHGRGALRALCAEELPRAAVRVYAPVGGHRDLLAYLVRRLLENGANSSFVAVAADPSVPVEALLKRPQHWIGDAAHARHPNIPLPRDLYGPERRTPRASSSATRRASMRCWPRCARRRRRRRGPPMPTRRPRMPRWPRRTPRFRPGRRRRSRSAPRSSSAPAISCEAAPRRADRADAARGRQDARRLRVRGARGGRFLPLLRRRGAPLACAAAAAGPDRREQRAAYRGRGVFVCISPWNFPLSIFVGPGRGRARRRQHRRGEAGRADAADRRRRRAHPARGRHSARTCCKLVPGDGKIGAALVADRHTAGVAFTGSTEVARAINRVLAGKDRPSCR